MRVCIDYRVITKKRFQENCLPTFTVLVMKHLITIKWFEQVDYLLIHAVRRYSSLFLLCLMPKHFAR